MTPFMDHHYLENQITAILNQLKMDEDHQAILTCMYMNPGLTMECITSAIGINNLHYEIQDLSERGLVLIQESERKMRLFPIPMTLLLQKFKGDLTASDCEHFLKRLQSIDKWIKYPLMCRDDVQFKSSHESDQVIEWLFDLHAIYWERVFCFGDYESFIDSIGIDPEVEWIKERAKKGRKASVVVTKDGKWAQRIATHQVQELRNCLINPGDFSQLFIMAFPDIQTTVLGSADGDVTFVQSKSVANQYATMVQSHLSESV